MPTKHDFAPLIHKLATTLRSAKSAAAATAAAAHATPDPAWSIPAVAATPADRDADSADCVAAFAQGLDLSLDLELSPDEARWLVQSPELDDAALAALATTTPDSSPAPAAAAACPAPSPARRPARSLLEALRRGTAAARGKLTSCLARPATLECAGCPGRRLGHTGPAQEWTTHHVNWT